MDDLLPAGVALQPACADLGPLGVEGDGEVGPDAVLGLELLGGHAAVGDSQSVVVVRPVREVAPAGFVEYFPKYFLFSHLATDMPASMSARRVSGWAEVGPMVQTMPERVVGLALLYMSREARNSTPLPARRAATWGAWRSTW